MKPGLIKRLDAIKKVKKLNKVMLVGGLGQVGLSLIEPLSYVYGKDKVLVTDISMYRKNLRLENFQALDALNFEGFEGVVKDFRPDCLFHLPAILSANAERNPEKALQINNDTFINSLKLSHKYNSLLFCPSSIASYGFYKGEEREMVNESTHQRPKTIYGVTKVYMELLGEYYCEKKGLDFRSLRYPGVMSPIRPEGGTTDYAIGEIIRDVVRCC